MGSIQQTRQEKTSILFIKHLKDNLNLVPVKIRQVHNLVKIEKENVPNDLFKKGRKRTLTAE